MPTFRGFVLQPTYQLEAGRPVVHLYGKLEDGRSFLVFARVFSDRPVDDYLRGIVADLRASHLDHSSPRGRRPQDGG